MNDILHQLILSNHIPLEVHHFSDHRLIIRTQIRHVLLHRLLSANETVKLTLETLIESSLRWLSRIERTVLIRCGTSCTSRSCCCCSLFLRGGCLALQIELGVGIRRAAATIKRELTLMFSRLSFISARKLGCLNSQVCEEFTLKSVSLARCDVTLKIDTHVLTVRRTSFFGILDFVEIVLVQLTNEGSKIRVLEV